MKTKSIMLICKSAMINFKKGKWYCAEFHDGKCDDFNSRPFYWVWTYDNENVLEPGYSYSGTRFYLDRKQPYNYILSDYFYTVQEIRKIKLMKLNVI